MTISRRLAGRAFAAATIGIAMCTTVGVASADSEVATTVTSSTTGTSSSPLELLEPCNGTYTHCEVNQCEAGVFYLNYDTGADSFSSPYGAALVKGEQGDIRDEPYRRHGPRGVRAMHSGKWGFYSTGCFPG